ncbi:hypothetical protein Zmor_024393 [Zophobas morio]|uniref:Uncharacterized protein n=1 Tax=Zophobas morio TaxID=2755281 RepID=A0AA38M808_9CUCU|nr:hypothetical protein Zmor_024393 [Zophobas morio]
MNINTETGFGTTLDLEVDCKNSPNINILIQSTENTLNQQLIQEKEIRSTEKRMVSAGVESLPVIVQKDDQLEQQLIPYYKKIKWDEVASGVYNMLPKQKLSGVNRQNEHPQ